MAAVNHVVVVIVVGRCLAVSCGTSLLSGTEGVVSCPPRTLASSLSVTGPPPGTDETNDPNSHHHQPRAPLFVVVDDESFPAPRTRGADFSTVFPPRLPPRRAPCKL
mmetsp:Transcript_22029/g.87450  ORF Transcript_22029/g.87450 Transcript_22029/m.87450 type:complete len:107 (+) Transcript_22029:482-802(+)